MSTRTYAMAGAGQQVQRTYTARRSAQRYADAHGLTIVDSWPANDPPPQTSDARAWDDWRRRQGYAGG